MTFLQALFPSIMLKVQPNLFGLLAIFLWSTGGVTISSLKSLPPFEVLFLSFLLIFLLTLPVIIRSFKNGSPDFSFKNCLLVFVGPPLQQILYVMSYRYAPAAEVDIVIYVWPILSLFLMGFFLETRIRVRHVFAGFLGFGTIILLAYKGESPIGISFGHFLALVSALLWSIYSLLLQKGLKANFSTIGVAFGMGTFVTIPLHFSLESFQIPSLLQGCIFLYYALVLSLFSFILWAKALEKGNGVFLTSIAYSKPVLSIIFLILFGYTAYSNVLALALGLILLSCLLSSDALVSVSKEFLWKRRHYFLKNKKERASYK